MADQQPPPDPLYGSSPVPPGGMGYPANTTQLTPQARREIFTQQMQQAAMRQLRVESSTDYSAVLVQGKPVNHVLHAILTIFTCLAWGIVWLILALTGGEKRFQLIVDEFGNVHWQNLG
jgi:hypothetical protein